MILDRDLAVLYGVQTKVLKQAVRRKAKRIPDDFMFEFTLSVYAVWNFPPVIYFFDLQLLWFYYR